MTIGERIRAARLEAGLSQRELAGQDITRNMLSVLEHDGANPSLATLQLLSEKLHRPVGYFLGEQDAGGWALREAENAPDDESFLAALGKLPDPDRVLVLKARGALLQENPARAEQYLAACENREAPGWQMWMGRTLMALGSFGEAREHLTRAEETHPEVRKDLEACCLQMEDYKMAYYYAKKQEKAGS